MDCQIQVVTWNSRPHLERLFCGIRKQAGVDYNVVIIDNASGDGTVEWIKNYRHPERSVSGVEGYNNSDAISLDSALRAPLGMTVKLIQNQTNRGFAAAHNQGFDICEAPYVLVLNPDTELQAGYLAEVLAVMSARGGSALGGESKNKIASVQGKLYRELPRDGKYGIIDSCGLKMKFLGQAVDIGQNQADKGNFEAQDRPQPLLSKGGEIFGATGACALYRVSALNEVADKHGIFDERFGSYKEDVDLAWRLKRAGYQAVFTPTAIAWHARGVGKGSRKPWRIRWLSLKNQVLMVLKNL